MQKFTLYAAALAVALCAAPASAATFSTNDAAFFAANPGGAMDDFEDATIAGGVITFDAGSIACSGGSFCGSFYGLSFGAGAETARSGQNAPYFTFTDTLTFTFTSAVNFVGVYIGGLGDAGAASDVLVSLDGGAFELAIDDYLAPCSNCGFTLNTVFLGITSTMAFTTLALTGPLFGDAIFLDDLIYGVNEVPLPAAVWLFAAGCAGLAGMRGRRRQSRSKQS